MDDHVLVAQKSVCFQESSFVESRDLHLLQLAPTMCLGHVPSSVPCLRGWHKRNCSGLNLEEEAAAAWKAKRAVANTCAKRTLQAEAAGEVRVGGERGGQFRTQVAVGEMMDQMPSAQGRCRGGCMSWTYSHKPKHCTKSGFCSYLLSILGD